MCICGHTAVWHKMFVGKCDRRADYFTGEVCDCERWRPAAMYEQRR